MNVACNVCGWRVTPGMFIEVNITPELLARLPAEWIMGYLEAEHFLISGCRGSVEVVPAVTFPGWRYIARTDQYERDDDGFRLTRAHVHYYGIPPETVVGDRR